MLCWISNLVKWYRQFIIGYRRGVGVVKLQIVPLYNISRIFIFEGSNCDLPTMFWSGRLVSRVSSGKIREFSGNKSAKTARKSRKAVSSAEVSSPTQKL